MTSTSFAKGHGTANDFVIVENLDSSRSFSRELVAQVCDRRRGIGADGMLIVSPADATSSGKWFMDYRNADGSVAEMCGNGARVFARYLHERGLEAGEDFTIATRGGDRNVSIGAGGGVRVGMGLARRSEESVMVRSNGRVLEASAWWIPNPHAAVFVDDVEALPRPLPEPQVDSDLFPNGQNVEYIEDMTDRGARDEVSGRVRVWERGVGETLSCGTGVCAASLALWSSHDVRGSAGATIEVQGGTLRVERDDHGQLDLIGPAVLVASGQFEDSWWRERP